MSNIVLYDKYTSGHHLSYLRIYSSLFCGLGLSVEILTADVLRVKAYMSDLPELKSGEITIAKINPRPFTWIEKKFFNRVGFLKDLIISFSAFLNFLEIKRNLKRRALNKNSVVFLMWFEPFISKYLTANFLRLFFSYDIAGLWFHPSDVKYMHDTSLRHRDLIHDVPILKYRKLRFLGLFDDFIVDRLREKYGGQVFLELPDIAEEHPPDLDSEMIAEILRRARGRKIVSLLGSLDRRKNIVSFFEVIDKYFLDEIFFVCAGKFHSQNFSNEEIDLIYSVASSNPEKVYFHDQHISSDVIFDSLFQVSDVIVSVYRNFTSSSNMIGKSALYGKFIIVAKEYLMCETVEKYGIGCCVESDSAKALLESITGILDNKIKLEGRFLDFLNDNSRQRLKENLRPLADFCRQTEIHI